MSTIKKTTLILAVLLFAVLSACQNDLNGDSTTSPTEQTATVTETEYATDDTEHSTEVAATETTVISTVISRPEGGIRQKELKIFFETYQGLMQEMTELLMGYDTEFIDIGYNGTIAFYKDGAGNRMSFDEEVLEKFKSYLAIAEAELRCEAVLSLRVYDGKRSIDFEFGTMEESGLIIYMPDGYVKLIRPDPSVTEGLLKSEIKLADGWYCYYF